MHGKRPPGSIQKLCRFENPRNELIVAGLSGLALERKMAADSRDVVLWDITPCRSMSAPNSSCAAGRGSEAGSAGDQTLLPVENTGTAECLSLVGYRFSGQSQRLAILGNSNSPILHFSSSFLGYMQDSTGVDFL